MKSQAQEALPIKAQRGERFAATHGSVIPPGLYANGMGGWFEVRYSNLPDDPGYDQGAPGVGITWGREKWYVLANSKEHFWAQWPYSMFRNCTPVSPNDPSSATGAGRKG